MIKPVTYVTITKYFRVPAEKELSVTEPSSLALSDEDFIAAFERGCFDRVSFPHRAHLRMAWLYVRHLGLARAIENATSGIRALAKGHGQSNLYHDTLTRAWVYVVAAAVADCPEVADFDQFLQRNPELLDKSCLLRYYSPERLSSAQARASWLTPDRQPIPGAPDAASGPEDAGPPVHPTAVSADEFRQAWRHIPSPVAVMTARDATRLHGTTVSSVTPVSAGPALLLLCVRHDSRILDIARAAGRFGVSYLAADQRSIAAHFADSTRPEGVAQFRGIPHILGRFGSPIITGGPVWFECALHDEHTAGDHQVVYGQVVAAGAIETPALQRLQGEWA